MIPPQQAPEEARRNVLRMETVGIVIFVLIAFGFILVRYGRYIDWHAR